MPSTGRCRSCGKAVYWGTTPANALMPVDTVPADYWVAPDEKGPVRIIVPYQPDPAGQRYAKTISALAKVGDPLPLGADEAGLRKVKGWTPHWATCPTRDKHRKTRSAGRSSRALSPA